jgi:hypothetical protein
MDIKSSDVLFRIRPPKCFFYEKGGFETEWRRFDQGGIGKVPKRRRPVNSAGQRSGLFPPHHRKRPHQTRQCHICRLAPIQDRLDDLRRQQRQPENPSRAYPWIPFTGAGTKAPLQLMGAPSPKIIGPN